MRDYKYGDLYFDSQHDKQMKIDVVGTGIVIDNSMIEMEAFELDEILCSESELKFGRCEANCVKFTTRNVPRGINGEKISITETVDGNTDEQFPYGKYKVYSDVPTSDRTKREITSYDAMYDIINADMKLWYAGLSFPMKLRKFRDSFFSYLGITQKETTLVNDGMVVNKTLTASKTDSESNITEESSISGKTVIEAICEINGVFGNINRDGLFEYVELKPIIQPLYPANDLYPRDDLFPREANSVSLTGHYITFDYEDFQSKAITQLEIRASDESAGVTVGTSGNNYVISGNFLVSDKNEDELRSIAEKTLSVIKNAAYTPIKSSEVVGNPCIELGDPIRFSTSREIVESYVLQRTLKGIQSKRDNITANGTPTHSSNVNSMKDTISNLSGRTNKLERTADHTLSEIANLDEKTASKFEQTSEQIQAEITRATGAESTLKSSITQTAESISTEITNRQSADNEMSSRITQNANSISTEVTNRKSADSELSTKITQTDDAIKTEVTNRQNADSNLSSQITQTSEKIQAEITRATGAESTLKSSITQTAKDIESEVTARKNADTDMSTRISQSAHSVSISASGSGNTAGITIALYDENGNLIDTTKTANITITGFVSFNDLANAGQTTINGANITSGTIKGITLISESGSEKTVVEDGEIGFYYNGTKLGRLCTGYFDNSDGNLGIALDGSAYAVGIGLNGKYHIRLNNSGTTLFYGTKAFNDYSSFQGKVNFYEDVVFSKRPTYNGYGVVTYGEAVVDCDTESADPSATKVSYTIRKLYTTTNSYGHKIIKGEVHPINTSDERLKNIHEMPDVSGIYMMFEPIEFTYKDGLKGYDHDHHYGLSAQGVKKAFNSIGIDASNSALVWSEKPNEEFNEQYIVGEDEVYHLNKDELHAFHIQMIQKHHREIELLKQENLALQNRLSILEQKMEVLENAYNNKNN